MKIRELVKVDSKGRITIPMIIREALDIHEGMTVLLIADKEKKEIILSPVPERAKLVEVNLKVEDRPGALAEITRTFAEKGVDIIATRCMVIKRGEIGECYMVVDLSKSLITNTAELKELISSLEPVKEYRVSEISP